MGIFQFQCCGVDNWNDWSKYNSLFQTAPPVFNSPDHNSNSRPDFNKDPQPVDKRRVPKSCCQAGSKLVIQFWKELKTQLRLLPKNFFVTFCQKKWLEASLFKKKKLSISFLQKECVQDPTSSNGLNPQGCFQMVLNEINKHESIIGSVAIVIAAVMVSISTYFPSNT